MGDSSMTLGSQKNFKTGYKKHEIKRKRLTIETTLKLKSP